jgi:cellular nucleic acid-binding protein
VLRKVKWIKPPQRRQLRQTHAYAIFSMGTASTANTLVRDGLILFGTKVRPKKQKQELIQCMRCRQWGHFVSECKVEAKACGNCGEAHRTNACQNRGKTVCITCKVSMHMSWDRSCPEFLRRCAIYNERNLENGMPYYPTEGDWTLAERPAQVPLDEKFPRKYAVNGLPFAANRHPGLAPWNPRSKTSKSQKGKTSERGIADQSEHENPNMIPLKHGREEGELPTDGIDGQEEYDKPGIVNENTDENLPYNSECK